MPKQSIWITTDPSCLQRCRIVTYEDGHTEYLYQQRYAGQTVTAQINPADYMPVDAGKYLKPYGYNDVDHLKAVYGSSWEMILAECIFETDIDEYV